MTSRAAMSPPGTRPLHGATPLDGGLCRFEVWAPGRRVELVVGNRTIPLADRDRGWHAAEVGDAPPGTRYSFRVDGGPPRPDPASRFQPQGLHGPSEVVAPGFPWSDGAWRGVPLEDLVVTELHVGTFTAEGTFDAAIPHLPALRDVGFTAVELMPVAQFPGARNWGYDGAAPFAVQNSYGGPAGLRRFVDAAHAAGLAVVLDVVYNHLGPEGNYLWGLAPYFTDRYHTPWGAAVNFDGPWADEVRDYFVQNALMWVRDFHVDALRLDAIHAIIDVSAKPFVEELASAVHAEGSRQGRPAWVIAECDRNDPRFVRPVDAGGHGLDAAWNDDFHHALHVLLTGEQHGYYADFGGVAQLATAIERGYVYTGQFSRFRNRRHGAPADGVPPVRWVICAQNHDQVGNRRDGERLSALVSLDKLKLSAAAVLLSPGIPLLFMGEEYGETAPFQYFVSHGDPALVEAVRRGRRDQFVAEGVPGEPPDPQDPATFERSRLRRDGLRLPGERTLLEFTRELLAARRRFPALHDPATPARAIPDASRRTLCVCRGSGDARMLALYNFSEKEQEIPPPDGVTSWTRVLFSADERWQGPGPAQQLPATAFRIRPFSAQLWRVT